MIQAGRRSLPSAVERCGAVRYGAMRCNAVPWLSCCYCWLGHDAMPCHAMLVWVFAAMLLPGKEQMPWLAGCWLAGGLLAGCWTGLVTLPLEGSLW